MGCVLANVTDFYLIRPLFEMEVGVPRFMGIARLLGRHAEVKLSVRKYHDAYAWGIQDKVVQRSGVLAFWRSGVYDESYCFGSEGGLPLYVADDHLSPRGSRKLAPVFRRVLSARGTKE